MPAMGANAQSLFQVSMEDHLLAGRAIMPEVLRRFPLEQALDLRQGPIADPVHGISLSLGRSPLGWQIAHLAPRGKPGFIPWVFPGCLAWGALPPHQAPAPWPCAGADSPEVPPPAFLRGTMRAWAGFCRAFPCGHELAAHSAGIKGLRDAPGWG